MTKDLNIYDNTPILTVIEPGRRGDSVQAVLKAIPRLKIIGRVDNGPAAVEIITAHQPALVLLDANLPGDKVWTALKQIKTEWPQTPCLVLVDTLEQQQMAEATGADEVLVAESSITEFCATIEKLLPTTGAYELSEVLARQKGVKPIE